MIKLRMRLTLIAGAPRLDQVQMSFVDFGDAVKVLEPLDRYFITKTPDIPTNVKPGDHFMADCELEANGWLKDATEFYLKFPWDNGPLNGGPAGTPPILLEKVLQDYLGRPVDVKSDLYQSLIAVRQLKHLIESERQSPATACTLEEFEEVAFRDLNCPAKYKPLISLVLRHQFSEGLVLLFSRP